MKKEKDGIEEFDINSIPAISKKSKKSVCGIPDALLKRLPLYFRCLRELINGDKMRVSSKELAGYIGISAPQLRQDLKNFDGSGQRGYGYNVMALYNRISEILGVGKKYSAVIFGAGNLGRAVYNSNLLEQRGVWVKAIFDIDKEIIGSTVGSIKIEDAKKAKAFCKNENIDIAVICFPLSGEAELKKLLSRSGVRGVLNFSQRTVSENAVGVPVQNVCAADSLMMLTYTMSQNDSTDEEK